MAKKIEVSEMSRESNASEEQHKARITLKELYEKSVIPTDDLMTLFGLYTRSSVLVKILVINDLYQRILNVPGAIVEFGCWYGQNLVFFENLRAIHEPFNKTRKIIGFDSFSGYQNPSEGDSSGDAIKRGNYDTSPEYQSYLEELISAHEQCNVLGHLESGHELVKGDVAETAKPYFESKPELTVALAYFDMGMYKPTKAALAAIRPQLIPGSVILLDEFTWSEAAGEAIAFREVFGSTGYRIEKSALTPMRAIVTMI